VLEVALALILLVAAALFVRSFVALRSVDPGFREQGVYFGPLEVSFRDYRDDARRAALFERVRRELERTPGVRAASFSLGVPLDPRAEFFVTRSPVSVEGRSAGRPSDRPEVALHVVGPHFFDALGVPLEAGRDFDARDDGESASVAIVNRSFAERFWTGEDPLGRRLTHDLVLLPNDSENTRTVVGVVSDFSYYRLEDAAEPQIFIPHAQTPWPQMHLVVRSDAALSALSSRLREVLGAAAVNVPVPELRPLSQVSGATSAPRLRATLLSGFSLTALGLAAVGLYSLLAFSVASRRREIGIRVALGARRDQLVGLFVREGLALAGRGAALGVLGALVTGRLLGGLLYGVRAEDPLSYAVIVLVLLIVSLVASFVPARRATAVGATEALRGDTG
jgi:putative ABC transport system permease protein